MLPFSAPAWGHWRCPPCWPGGTGSPLPNEAIVAARPAVAPACAAAAERARVVCLAEAYKATLSAAQLAEAQRPYSRVEAARWSNFPQQFSRPQRVGVALGSLTAPQLGAAKALLASVLAAGVPNEGYDELNGNLATDNYLGVATKKLFELRVVV